MQQCSHLGKVWQFLYILNVYNHMTQQSHFWVYTQENWKHKNLYLCKNLFTICIISNCEKVETTYMSINYCMDKQNPNSQFFMVPWTPGLSFLPWAVIYLLRLLGYKPAWPPSQTTLQKPFQWIFVEHLLCARHGTQCWRYTGSAGFLALMELTAAIDKSYEGEAQTYETT